MDLRSLHIFIEVADLHSFTRAGEKLGYSQPTVSFQIKQLEQELGVPLFDRIGHTVSLTDAGRDILPYAQNICRMSQEMAMDAGKRRDISGTVRLGIADSLCAPLIAGSFAQFRADYPQVSVQVTSAGTAELFRLLDHNEVDMVCTLDSHIYNSAYVIANEESIGVHFAVSSQNPLASRDAVTIEELLDQPFLLTEKGMSYRRILDEELARRSLQICPILESGRADLLCALAVQDIGACFLPDYVTNAAVQNGTLVRLPVDQLHIELWKQLLYRRDKWVSRPMQAMLDHLCAIALQEEPV